MISFIDYSAAIQALYRKMEHTTCEKFGDVKLPHFERNHMVFSYPTIGALFEQRLILRKVLPHNGNLSYPLNVDALTTLSFMMDTLRQVRVSVESEEYPIHNQLLTFWLIFNASLANNTAASAYLLREGVTLSEDPYSLRGTFQPTTIHLSGSNWVKKVDPALKCAQTWLQMAEELDKPYILANPTLLEFFKATALCVQQNCITRMAPGTFIHPLQLKERLSQKNARAEQYGFSSWQTVLFNPDAVFHYEFDRAIMIQLEELMTKIATQQLPRMQIVLFANKITGYSLALDMAWNNERLEVVCVDPSQAYNHYKFLDILTRLLLLMEIPNVILACQANLYPIGEQEDILGYAIADLLKNASFEALSRIARLAQPEFRAHNTPELFLPSPPLPNIHWFDYCALGSKAIILGKDRDQRVARFKKMYPTDFEQKLQQFDTWYHLDSTPYIEGRCLRLLAHLGNAPKVLIPVEEIKRGLNVGPTEPADRALRRAAAGFGPRAYLDSLCEQLEACDLNKKDTTGKTPLLWALTKAKPTRALRLLQAGVDTSLADCQGKTPKETALESPNADIRKLEKRL